MTRIADIQALVCEPRQYDKPRNPKGNNGEWTPERRKAASERAKRTAAARRIQRDLDNKARAQSINFRRLKIPQRAHPLVRRLYEEMNEQQVTVRLLAEKTGLFELTISQWGYRSSPALASIEACFNALGYDLVARKRRGE